MLESRFGQKSKVVYSNDEYHFEICLISATPRNPYHLLYTSGLSHFTQDTSDKYPEFKHVELYFLLPDYWKIDSIEKQWHWPIYWLNRIAEVPQKFNSWFGPGDTIPAGNPPVALSEKMAQNHFMLMEPYKLQEQLNDFKTSDKDIRFLAIKPLFQQEFDYKTRKSAKVLTSYFQFKNQDEMVDDYREAITGKNNIKFKWLAVFLIFGAMAFITFLLLKYFNVV